MQPDRTRCTMSVLAFLATMLGFIPPAVSGSPMQGPRSFSAIGARGPGSNHDATSNRGGGRYPDGKRVSFVQFYAKSLGIMKPGKRYGFPGCLYYKAGVMSIGSKNIYSTRLITDVDVRFDDGHQLSALLKDGDQYCGTIVAELDRDGNIAVLRFH